MTAHTLLTIPEVADMWGESPGAVQKAAERAGLLVRIGRKPKIYVKDLEVLKIPAMVEGGLRREREGSADRLREVIESLIHPVVLEWEGRVRIPAEIRRSIFERDGSICAYCHDTEGPFHLDHIHPVSKGGSSAPENLTVACAPCNHSKGCKTLDKWNGRPR